MDAFWEWLGSPTSALPLPTTKVTSVNENNNATVSFDRMRNMLVRAAEIRESEQQQIFDTLDEIHARLSPLESIGAVRKRLMRSLRVLRVRLGLPFSDLVSEGVHP